MSWDETIKGALLSATGSVWRYEADRTKSPPYVVWAETEEREISLAEGAPPVKLMTGRADLFTRDRNGEKLLTEIPAALGRVCSCRLVLTENMDDMKLLHCRWEWRIFTGEGLSDTVTLYTAEIEVDPETYTDRAVNNVTVLRGVRLKVKRGAERSGNGYSDGDRAELFIPLSGGVGSPKTYTPPPLYERALNRSLFWTVFPGARCFFLPGEISEPDARLQDLAVKYGEVFTVTAAETVTEQGAEFLKVRGV